MEEKTLKALQYAESAGHVLKYTPRTAFVYESRPIHCKRCGYTPHYSLKFDSSYFCPRCGALVIHEHDLEEYNTEHEDVEED